MQNKLNRGHNGKCIRMLMCSMVCSHLCFDYIHFNNKRCFNHHGAMKCFGLKIIFCCILLSACPFDINCLFCISLKCWISPYLIWLYLILWRRTIVNIHLYWYHSVTIDYINFLIISIPLINFLIRTLIKILMFYLWLMLVDNKV